MVSSMVGSSLYAAFLVTAVILIVIPGADMLYIVAMAARGGPITGLVAAVGTAVGLTVHTAAVAVGLTTLVTAVPQLYDVLRWAGAVYLLCFVYVAVKALRTGTPLGDADPKRVEGIGRTRVFWQAVLVDVLNPKTVLFFAALLPQFVAPELGSLTVQLLILGGTFVMLDLLLDGAIGLVTGRIAQASRCSHRRSPRPESTSVPDTRASE